MRTPTPHQPPTYTRPSRDLFWETGLPGSCGEGYPGVPRHRHTHPPSLPTHSVAHTHADTHSGPLGRAPAPWHSWSDTHLWIPSPREGKTLQGPVPQTPEPPGVTFSFRTGDPQWASGTLSSSRGGGGGPSPASGNGGSIRVRASTPLRDQTVPQTPR